MRIVFVLAATGAGAAVGWVYGLVPMWPVARLATAAVMGAVVGAVGVVLLVFLTLSRPGSGGLGGIPPSLVTYGPTMLGGGTALLAALWVASGMAVAGDS